MDKEVEMHTHNGILLQLLLLSRFSPVQLCATPETAAHQAPSSLGFSRQEYWSGVPLPSQKSAFESVLMRWMKLEPIIQSEVSQKEKHQYSILTYIWNLERR